MKRLILILLFSLGANLCFADTVQDPTKPTGTRSVNSSSKTLSSSKLILNAVMINPQSKQAIINGKGYVKGQSVLGFKVLSIDRNQVVLIGSSGKKTLFVNNNNIKKDVNNGF
jgi:hypothetical protein